MQGLAAVHVLLMAFEPELPTWQLALSLGCNLFYWMLLQTFPFIQLTDPAFIVSCGIHLLYAQIMQLKLTHSLRC